MWHPPEAVRHALPPGEWPSAAEAAASRWFSHVDVGPIRLTTRTWVPAMVPWRATESGFVTDEVLAWYERFAQGRPRFGYRERVTGTHLPHIRDLPRRLPGIFAADGWECMPTALADARGPFGRNVAPAGRIRRALREAGLSTPIVVSGGISTFRQAEDALARGDANYCEGLDQMHKQVTCKLWDRASVDEPGVRSYDGKRRVTARAWTDPDEGGGNMSVTA